MNQVFYKAKVACRIGGAFRRVGDVFPLPRFETAIPPYLEEVPGAYSQSAVGASTGQDIPATDDKPSADGAPVGSGPGRSPGRRQHPKATPPGPMPEDLPGVVRD